MDSRTHAAVKDERERRWREAGAMTADVERAKKLEALIEELAATDPSRAIELATSEPDSELSTRLLQAALRGWSGKDSDAAAEWALSQTQMDQGLAMASVFDGAARDPEHALQFARELSERNPEHSADYGSYLVAALARNGEFGKAADFAAGGTADVRVDWLNAAFARWAEQKPRDALEHAEQFSDPEIQQTAFRAAVSHWAQNSPREVAEYALSHSAGADRDFALNAALRAWAADDPVGAAGWIGRFEPSPQFDLGAAVIASQPDAIREPEVATSWAEGITDPQLRVRVLAMVVNEWSLTDPVAARHYAETSANLRPEERPGVLAALEPDFKPISLLP